MVDIEVVEPDESWGITDEEREVFQFVTTGGLRIQIQGVWYRYRRPLFGELSELQTGLQVIGDELTSMTNVLAERAADLAEKAKALEASTNQEVDTAAFMAETSNVRRDQEKTRAEAEARGAELYEQWWRQVLKKLRPKQLDQKMPPQMPSWVVDRGLPPQVVKHWIKVPLDRGRSAANPSVDGSRGGAPDG